LRGSELRLVTSIAPFLIGLLLLSSGVVAASEGESQWPMLNSDPAHTGASKYNVSTYAPRLLWNVDPLGSVIENNSLYLIPSRPVIGPDGNIIVVQHSGNISAVGPDGRIIWRSCISGHPLHCTPAIGADGTIYLGVENETHMGEESGAAIYAISKNGAPNWRTPLNDTWDFPQSICIDQGGTLYCTAYVLNYTDPLNIVSTESVIFALNPSGKMLWSSNIPSTLGTSPALANDGSIYVHARDGLFSFTKNGSQRWVVPLENSYEASEVVTTQNSSAVLIHNGTLMSISSNGSIEWQSERHFYTWYRTPLAYYEHTIVMVGNYNEGITVFSENGTTMGYFAPFIVFGFAQAAISKNGLIIVFNAYSLSALSIDGQEIWRIEPDLHYSGSAGQDSPIIGEDGRIYLLIFDDDTDSMSLVAFGENATVLDGGPWSVYLLPSTVVLLSIMVWLATRKKRKKN
jgi:hypothetical protein